MTLAIDNLSMADRETYGRTLEPLEDLSPSQFATRHRVMHPIYCSERPGPWDSSVFPHQDPLMDLTQEAVTTGKRGVVLMKSGQGGGTDLAINCQLWLKLYLPGPQLFMAATEKVAEEFGRERFEPIIRDMAPLAARYRPNPRGSILVKRFVDGKILLSGGQSVFNLQSTPYRVVVIDELDSLVVNLGGEGDPVKLAEVRTDSYTGQTLLIAYAHPTTRERGSAKLYFEMSDQRRGFVRHDCGAEFYLQWEHVKAGDEKDPDTYHYVCPQCGAVISDAERVVMVRRVQYRSVLPPEEARRRAWIGGHFSQLYYPAKTIRSLAQRWIECRDENAKRVFVNKILGEPYDPKVQKIDIDSLRSLVSVRRRDKDPEFYLRGQVPPFVRFLTAGQDSRATELHYAVWGWGLRRAVDRTLHLCGWLIDWGVIERAYSLTFNEAEFHVFDDLIYRRSFYTADGNLRFNVLNAGHDTGYAPTQLPIIRYCRNFPSQAIPTKGASEDATSACSSPYVRWGSPMRFKSADSLPEADATSTTLLINTFMLKTDWFGWINQRVEISDETGTRKVPRLAFPEDVEEAYLVQSKNEALTRGKREGELVWKKTGPNHWADCNITALALAYQHDGDNQFTAEEYRQMDAAVAHQQQQARQSHPPTTSFATPDGRAFVASQR